MRSASTGSPLFRALVLGSALVAGPAWGAETKISATNAANAKLHVRIGPGRGGGERKLEAAEPARASEAAIGERPREEAPDSAEELEIGSLREAERVLFPEPRRRPDLDGELPLAMERPGPTLTLSGLLPPSTARPSPAAASAAWPRDLNPPDLPCSYEQRT